MSSVLLLPPRRDWRQGFPRSVKQTFALTYFVGGATNRRTHEGSGTGTQATGCGTASRPTRRRLNTG
jgi:hypothetical protein